MSVRNLTHGSLVVRDGTSPTPNSVAIPIQSGDFKFSRTRTANTIHNRGALKEFTRGTEEACAISFSIVFERYESKSGAIPSAESPTPVEALTGTGAASTWRSTLPNRLNSPFGTDLVFTIADVEGGASVGGSGQNEIMTFTKFVADKIDFSEGEASNTLDVSGKALVLGPTITTVAS